MCCKDNEQRNENKVYQIGTVSPTSMIAGRVIDIDGICFTLMAMTHRYGMGNICDTRFLDERYKQTNQPVEE